MVTFESDSKCVVVEKCEMMDYKPFTTTREIKGDLMLTVSTYLYFFIKPLSYKIENGNRKFGKETTNSLRPTIGLHHNEKIPHAEEGFS